MRIKRFEIDPYDAGPYFEDQMNKFIDGATHVHTMQAPYNDRKPILVYAFYPDEDKSRPIQPLEEHFKIGDEVEFNQGNLLLGGSIIGFVVKGDSTYTTNHVWHPKKRRPMINDEMIRRIMSSDVFKRDPAAVMEWALETGDSKALLEKLGISIEVEE